MMQTEQIKNYTSSFNKHKLQSKAPAWLKDLQTKSLKQFTDTGFPTRKNEDWKYTNITPIANSLVDVLESESKPEKLAPIALEYIHQFSDRIVFINGWLSQEHTNLNNLPKGIFVSDLNEEIKKDNPTLKFYLTKEQSQDAFTNLNKAFSERGAYIEIGKNITLKDPIHIIYLNSNSQSPKVAKSQSQLLITPHTFITIAPFSQAKIIESYISFTDDNYFTNAVTNIFVDENAKLEHCKIQAESPKAFHVGSITIKQERDSYLQTFNFSVGSQIGRNNLEVFLEGENSFASVDGLYALNQNQLIDNHTTIDHLKPHATSQQLYKGILDDQSHAVFNGRVIVRPKAQLTDSSQLNKNLILSDKALIDTKPQLEISANDVKCTHGATVGQINRDELFYFESRAIPADQARKLLIHGFAEDALEKVQDDQIRELLSNVLKERYFA